MPEQFVNSVLPILYLQQIRVYQIHIYILLDVTFVRIYEKKSVIYNFCTLQEIMHLCMYSYLADLVSISIRLSQQTYSFSVSRR